MNNCIDGDRYVDNNEKYLARLQEFKLQELSNHNPSNVTEVDPATVSPYSINIALGYPIFLGVLSKDYEQLESTLKQLLPKNCVYPSSKTHITLHAPFGGKTKELKEPTEGYYQTLSSVVRDIQFKPFSLRVSQLMPNGIILWISDNNPDEIFKVRKQLFEKLIQAKQLDETFNFNMRDGLPFIPDIVHTTVLRVVDKDEWVRKFDEFEAFRVDLNQKIEQGRLFKQALTVREVKMVKISFEPGTTQELHNLDGNASVETVTNVLANS